MVLIPPALTSMPLSDVHVLLPHPLKALVSTSALFLPHFSWNHYAWKIITGNVMEMKVKNNRLV